ncbi:MAG: S-layer homology domain-containing protein [Leptolyngbyaceae cyanobacterium]
MDKQKTGRAIAGFLTLGLLASCAGTSVGDSVQQSLEADPQLEESPAFEADAEVNSDDSEAGTAATGTDSANEADNTESGDFEPDDPESGAAESGGRESDGAEIETTAIAAPPEPGDPEFIGPVRPNGLRTATAAEQSAADGALTGVPADLKSYIRDLQALDLLTLSAVGSESTSDTEAGNESEDRSPFGQTISRREYARWLFASYNAIYADEPGDRLRLGSAADEPAFQDVPTGDPDFAVIQGLADAGIIPSAFTGNSTDVNFRPDAPLVREDLILWKVPLDTRAALPTTTSEAVTKSWGFQDTASIEGAALQAIAADFQLGDFANFSRAFGYTTLFRPDKAVTRAEAAAVLWRFGTPNEGITAVDASSTPASE